MISRRRKGQYLVIQEVLVYGMGLFMLIGVLSTFTYMKNTIQDSIRETQLEVVSNTITNGLMELKDLDEPSQVTLNVPAEITDKQYTVTTSLIGSLYILTVTDGQLTHKQLLRIPVNDSVIRGSEQIIITKSNNEIKLRGVSYS
jgi:hypothetical protein